MLIVKRCVSTDTSAVVRQGILHIDHQSIAPVCKKGRSRILLVDEHC